MSTPWQVRVYRQVSTEPVPAAPRSGGEAEAFLAGVAAERGPGTPVEPVDPSGDVVTSQEVPA